MSVYLDDGDVVLHHGDALATLRTMPSASVHCIVTSPPFWALRDYDVDGQIGLEATPDEWCAALVAVFREARRVLRPDGVAWIEVGDTYNANTASNPANLAANPRSKAGVEGHVPNAWSGTQGGTQANRVAGIKPKDLVGAPWLLAFALRADGWYLRSDTIWHRPNPMPESVTDRPTKAHSHVFLLSREPRYFYDADAIREPAGENTHPRGTGSSPKDEREAAETGRYVGFGKSTLEILSHRNARSVWTIATEATPFAHFATFPQALAARCILAGTSGHGCCVACGAPWTRTTERTVEDPGNRSTNGKIARSSEMRAYDARREVSVSTLGWAASCACNAPVEPCTVLDPFAGTATTLLVARRHGRRAVGIELSTKYLAIAATRLQQLSLLDHNPAT